MNDVSVIQSGDGSDSVFSSLFNSSYHSRYGAITESKCIFLDAGLDYFIQTKKPETTQTIKIFEMGFGTGLNAFITYIYAFQRFIKVSFTTIEAFPLPIELIDTLNYSELMGFKVVFDSLHHSGWDQEIILNDNFRLTKILSPLDEYEANESFDIIYYDAFGPESQPELWSDDVLNKMYGMLTAGGVLTSFCAKGTFKRSLKSVGFTVQSIPGPPGKREITRALKL
jgi:tRNA U34 5-methylaminomethyl-2-thiouridine-forming methyltransferase MnmC